MSTVTVTLAGFLEARIAEDEAVARNALHPDAVEPGTWSTEHHNSEYHSEPNRAHIAEDRSGHYWSVAHEVFIPIAEHIARHDPARVLARCAADRRMVEEHAAGDEMALADSLHFTQNGWTQDRTVRCTADLEPYPCKTLRILAAPYSDHPDFQESWRV